MKKRLVTFIQFYLFFAFSERQVCCVSPHNPVLWSSSHPSQCYWTSSHPFSIECMGWEQQCHALVHVTVLFLSELFDPFLIAFIITNPISIQIGTLYKNAVKTKICSLFMSWSEFLPAVCSGFDICATLLFWMYSESYSESYSTSVPPMMSHVHYMWSEPAHFPIYVILLWVRMISGFSQTSFSLVFFLPAIILQSLTKFLSLGYKLSWSASQIYF